MPFGSKPYCSACKTSVSPMWRKDERGSIMCNSCYLNFLNASFKDDTCSVISDNDSVHSGSNSNSGLRFAIVAAKQLEAGTANSKDLNNGAPSNALSNSNTRKSNRIKPYTKSKAHSSKSNPGKGKSRRFIFKRTIPMKAPQAVATVVTSQSLFYQGFYYQIGDIVSLVDHSGDIYYAQIQGLLQDQYCEKSAIISWLLPTTAASDCESFDPSTYYLGPTEELPRKLEYMEFVCHAPDDYYKPKHVKLPGLHKEKPDTGFIWTNIGPRACKVPTTDEIFGINLSDSSMVDADFVI